MPRAALADYLEHERPADTGRGLCGAVPGRRLDRHPAARRPAVPAHHQHHRRRGRTIHDLEIDDADRKLGTPRPHDARHTYAYRLSAAFGHNRAELERRLGPANDRYLKLCTNPPEDIAAGWAENL